MSIGNDLNRTLAQFIYVKCMIVFKEEEEMKKRKTRRRRQEDKKHFHFFDCQVRTGCGF